MGFDREKLKQIRRMILYIALIVLVLIYSDEVFGAIGVFIGFMKPFIYGGVIAFILNIPLRFIENRIFRKWTGKLAEKLKRPIGIVLSILFVVLILNIVIMTVAPQLGKTLVELGTQIPVFAEEVVVKLEAVSVEYPQLEKYVADLENIEIDWQSALDSLIQFLKNGMTNVLSSTVTMAGSIIGGVMNLFIGFIFAIYILGQKEVLCNQGKRIVSAFCSERAERFVLKVCSIANRNFSNFISGQCTEAVILGSMFVIAMTIFRMPYALLVGVLIAFTALIPIVGAFIGCFVGAFLIMVNNPMQALIFIVMFLVIQQIEGNLIYPKVVGNKVGLPSIWVLMAVSIGGSLFGVAGMLFFIPLISTFYILLRDTVNERNARKQKKEKKPYYHNTGNKKKYYKSNHNQGKKDV
ncbi:MAG: AI-2E family transporter [Lachnospiraceae bacterium]|nr:AI-2E family transporter [Lachnospiraceae bacterium]